MKKTFNKILIIRVGAIGDVVHTTNLIHSIKKAYPDVQIHYATSSLIKPLIENDKDIQKVWVMNAKFSLFSSAAKELANEIKQENYDLVINLQPSLKMKGVLFLSGVKNVLTYKKSFKVHAVKNFWQTGLKAFPNMQEEKDMHLYLPTETIENAKNLLKNYPKPYIILNAGGVFAKRQGRTYPVEKWVELGNKLQEKYNGTVILNGAKEDKEVLSPLNEIKNSVNFIGELSLLDSVGVISQGDLMISGDSGPLHIATALGVKSIGLFGSMPANRTGCYSNGINVVSKKSCVPCNRRKCKYLQKGKIYTPCMEEITVDEIINNISL